MKPTVARLSLSVRAIIESQAWQRASSLNSDPQSRIVIASEIVTVTASETETAAIEIGTVIGIESATVTVTDGTGSAIETETGTADSGTMIAHPAAMKALATTTVSAVTARRNARGFIAAALLLPTVKS